MLHIHPNARTILAVHAKIARSSEPSGTVAQRYGISSETVRKWRKRGASDWLDRSARPHRLPWKTIHTKSRTSQTNGMVERFNGRVGSEVLGINIYSHRALEPLLSGK